LERIHEQQILSGTYQDYKAINEGLPVLQKAWTEQANADVKAKKQVARDLIDDIDALADRMKTLPAFS